MNAESNRTEFKQSWQEDCLKAVCAFANAHGGALHIGKDDAGRVVGVSDVKRQLEDIPNKIKNALGVTADVFSHDENGRICIEISVPPYSVPISLRGRYYFRSGATTQELTGTPLNDFLLKKAESLGTPFPILAPLFETITPPPLP
ncbi:MAG: ATP-binding protein, partial [Verrucomicrobiota bacterium]|nr:ATP-binding protein [Verrucomicrobiota bacterium]